ncbi:MAG: hypothetical protein MUC99_08985, partial [Anaerolineae bacterium]|nr:hypothetical protein [Anaerolineae bacterium]
MSPCTTQSPTRRNGAESVGIRWPYRLYTVAPLPKRCSTTTTPPSRPQPLGELTHTLPVPMARTGSP